MADSHLSLLILSLSFYMCSSIRSAACIFLSLCSSAFCTLASDVPGGCHSFVLVASSSWLLWEAVMGKGLFGSSVHSLQSALGLVYSWSVCTIIKIPRCFWCLSQVSLFCLVQLVTFLYSHLASNLTRLEFILQQNPSGTAGLQHSLPNWGLGCKGVIQTLQ